MTYVYGCDDREHPRKEIVHKMGENPVVLCDECGKKMHRIPQAHRFYMQPEEVLVDWMDDNYRRWRKKKPLRSPDRVKRPGKPIPQRDYEFRKRKPNAHQSES